MVEYFKIVNSRDEELCFKSPKKVKFGKYSSYNCNTGFKNTDAGVMIIHSADDEAISQEKGFDFFYNLYKNDQRFEFVKFENRGHSYVYYSDISREYKDEFNRMFGEYLDSLDEEFTAEIKESYLNENLDKKLLYELDEELMHKIIKFYDNFVKWAHREVDE